MGQDGAVVVPVRPDFPETHQKHTDDISGTLYGKIPFPITYPQSASLCGPATESDATGVTCCQAGTRICCARLDQACCKQTSGQIFG